MNKQIAGLSLAVAAVFLLSCKDEISGPGIDEIVFPDSNVSYGRHVEAVFLRACAVPGCHTADSPSGGLVLETYQETMHNAGVVIPGDTLNSRLIWRIEGSGGRERMPLFRPPLNENQLKGMRTWILEGAQNN
jgi:hypothetical protein